MEGAGLFECWDTMGPDNRMWIFWICQVVTHVHFKIYQNMHDEGNCEGDIDSTDIDGPVFVKILSIAQEFYKEGFSAEVRRYMGEWILDCYREFTYRRE
jgi:hypothetical protein